MGIGWRNPVSLLKPDHAHSHCHFKAFLCPWARITVWKCSFVWWWSTASLSGPSLCAFFLSAGRYSCGCEKQTSIEMWPAEGRMPVPSNDFDVSHLTHPSLDIKIALTVTYHCFMTSLHIPKCIKFTVWSKLILFADIYRQTWKYSTAWDFSLWRCNFKTWWGSSPTESTYPRLWTPERAFCQLSLILLRENSAFK